MNKKENSPANGKLEGQIISLFPTPVLVTEYKEDFTEEFNYIKNLDYLPPHLFNKNFRSKDTHLLKNKSLEKIKNFCIESLELYEKKILGTDEHLTITQCWSLKNPLQSSMHGHAHPNSIISGVFYFNCNKELPPLQFKKEMETSFKLPSSSYNIFNSEMFHLSPQSGNLILFPSYLKHSVPVNRDKEMRYSMAFNTFCSSVLGEEQNLTYVNIKEDCERDIVEQNL